MSGGMGGDPGQGNEQFPDVNQWLRRSDRVNRGVLPRHLNDFVMESAQPRVERQPAYEQYNLHGFPPWPPVPVSRQDRGMEEMPPPSVHGTVSPQDSATPDADLIQFRSDEVSVTRVPSTSTSTTIVGRGVQMQRTTSDASWMRRDDGDDDDDDYSSVSTEYPEAVGNTKEDSTGATGFGNPQYFSTPNDYAREGTWRRPPPPPYSPTNPFHEDFDWESAMQVQPTPAPRPSYFAERYPDIRNVPMGGNAIRIPPPIPPRRAMASSAPIIPPVPPRQRNPFGAPDFPQQHQQQNYRGYEFQNQQQAYAQPPPPPPRIPRQQQQAYVPPPSQVPQQQINDTTLAMSRLMEQQLQTIGENSRKMWARSGKAFELPEFNGSPRWWPLFYSRYVQTSADCGFTTSENVERLRRCLKGEAQKLVQSLFILPNADVEIMRRLFHRYGRPRQIIGSLIEDVRSTPAIKDGDLEALMDFAAAVSNLVITVRSLNSMSHVMNPQLLEELIAKLPGTLRLDWGRESNRFWDREPNLLDFTTWLDAHSAAASQVTPVKVKAKDPDEKKKDKKGKKGKLDSVFATTDKGNDEKGDSKRTPKCIKCNGEHWLPKCPEYLKMSSDKRWEFVKEKKLCFRCYRLSHTIKDRKCKGVCGVKDEEGKACQRAHHRLLHPTSKPEFSFKPEAEKAGPSNPKKEEKDVKEVVASLQGGPSSLLKIIPIQVWGPKGSVIINALLDDGSTVSLISAEISRKIGLKGKSSPLRVDFADSSGMVDENSRRVSCVVRGIKQDRKYQMDKVHTVTDLVLPKPPYLFGDLVKQRAYLKGASFMYLDAPAQMLIGAPHGHLSLSKESKEGGPMEPIASRTKLGWVLYGPLGKTVSKENLFHCSHEEMDDYLHELVRESFAIDSIGVVRRKSMRSVEDAAAEEKICKVTRRVGQRWETGLLWKVEPGSSELPQLPPSREMALKRFLSLEKKFAREPDFHAEYLAKMQDYLNKGYAHQLSPTELAIKTPCEWFLPHFATTHPNKPRKIRVVFDAAAKSHGKCLNDFLLTGSDMLPNLPGMLLTFRIGEIAVMGDIVEMFPQVRIRKEDQPAQRTLWRNWPNEEIQIIQWDAMMFGNVCSPYAAQYIRNRNADEFATEFPEAVDTIKNKHYMDDLVRSYRSVTEAVSNVRDVIHVHAQGGFQIRKWVSNSLGFLQQLHADDEPTNDKDLTTWSENPIERALGLHWLPREDAFTFKLNKQRAGESIVSGEQIPTKREVLRLIMLIWDPLGFLSHFVIKAKILQQQIWRSKIGWDDEIPASLMKAWTSWIRRLPEIEDVRIPRMYSADFEKADDIQLHVFADASEVAYSCVAYFRIRVDDNISVSFVMAKSRVAPLKPCTIPRLELQAAVMAARLGNFIQEQVQVPLNGVFYWTDSTTVLKWIRSEARRYTQFVANRVGEIQETTNVKSWKWVPTRDNPADDATREGSTNLSSDARFWTGPAFLQQHENQWPRERECTREDEDVDQMEIRREFGGVIMDGVFAHVPDISRFSKLSRLIGATTQVLKVIAKWRKREILDQVTLQEKATHYLICQRQWLSFPEEMFWLSQGRPIKKSSRLYQLNPFLENGLLRMKSRLATHPDVNLRTPVILCHKDYLTELIIRNCHEKFAHHGENFVRNELRQTYWITNARATIKRVIRKCMVCRKRTLKPEEPMMGDLPNFRIQPQPRPFSIVGMDYFGPMEVTVNRTKPKRYGVIFVCMSTRAIHLEIAHSLTTDSAILAIRRFIGRRGQPIEIISDNGTNLKGAERELREALQHLNETDLKRSLEARRIRWRLIPPRSPHMGGSYERLVRSVKTALRAILHSHAPKDEVLLTLMAEAEAIVNSRPLTEVPVDPEAPEALTPFHFLLGTSSPHQPPGVFEDRDLLLSKKWKHAQVLADHFWKRWMREYVPTLQQRKKWHDPVPKLAVGDYVIVYDESLRRGSFPIGIVTAVREGSADQVRVADISVAQEQDPKSKKIVPPKMYQRPAVMLARLGLQSSTIAEAEGFPSTDSGNGREYSGDCDDGDA